MLVPTGLILALAVILTLCEALVTDISYAGGIFTAVFTPKATGLYKMSRRARGRLHFLFKFNLAGTENGFELCSLGNFGCTSIFRYL